MLTFTLKQGSHNYIEGEANEYMPEDVIFWASDLGYKGDNPYEACEFLEELGEHLEVTDNKSESE